MTVDLGWLRALIRTVDDFPEPGISFKDIAPLLADVDAFRYVVDCLADRYSGQGIDHVAGIESRGFILAAPVAYRLGTGLMLIRKAGKLPFEVISHEYDLEYGTDRVEVHRDAAEAGERVLIIDDVLATGGTAAAAAELVKALGAEVAGLAFLLELSFLDGAAKLEQVPHTSLLQFDK